MIKNIISKIFGKNVVMDKQNPPTTNALTEEMMAELIKDPRLVSSRMVKKIVLNGLFRLEKEGNATFDDDNI